MMKECRMSQLKIGPNFDQIAKRHESASKNFDALMSYAAQIDSMLKFAQSSAALDVMNQVQSAVNTTAASVTTALNVYQSFTINIADPVSQMFAVLEKLQKQAIFNVSQVTKRLEKTNVDMLSNLTRILKDIDTEAIRRHLEALAEDDSDPEIADVVSQIEDIVLSPSWTTRSFVERIQVLWSRLGGHSFIHTFLIWMMCETLSYFYQSSLDSVLAQRSEKPTQIVKHIRKETIYNQITLVTQFNYQMVSLKQTGVFQKGNRKAKRIGSVHQYEIVQVIEKRGRWCRIILRRDGQLIEGWVRSKHLIALGQQH